jgi:hypothetical protein
LIKISIYVQNLHKHRRIQKILDSALKAQCSSDFLPVVVLFHRAQA